MRRPLPRTAARGIALVEVLVAAVLLAIGVLGALGLQVRSQGALADAGMRAEAVIAANKLIGIMALDQANVAAYAFEPGSTPSAQLAPWYAETVSRAHIPGATVKVDVDAQPAADRTRVSVTIAWTRKSGAAANSHTVSAWLAPST
ncbi:type IV pilus modification PilV family protein [Massilia sp. TN1-12]|uniref:type IV pilus modification PilV family protein n=1 Tax=Massilia paldalensis TaxID=3377675 RepID=UPI00384DFFCF